MIGHIVAASTETGSTLIIPAFQVLEDLHQRFDGSWRPITNADGILVHTSTAVAQQSSAQQSFSEPSTVVISSRVDPQTDSADGTPASVTAQRTPGVISPRFLQLHSSDAAAGVSGDQESVPHSTATARKRAKGVPKRPKPKEQPRLRCPFRVHGEQDRSSEGDAEFQNCNQDQTFAGTEKLNEHLDRVHSPKWWCPRCKHQFVICGGRTLAAQKKDHGACVEKPWPENQKEWVKHNLMTEEQYLRSKTWKEENIPRPPACDGK
ncbi:hypothetical protein ACJZ2D_016586 [Fusarium nematophilum]